VLWASARRKADQLRLARRESRAALPQRLRERLRQPLDGRLTRSTERASQPDIALDGAREEMPVLKNEDRNPVEIGLISEFDTWAVT